jgi:hypothetical protein
MKQQSFIGLKKQISFGGELLKGKRKTKRPLCTKRPIHLVIKAENLASNFPGVSFVKVRAKVTGILKHQAKCHGVLLGEHSVNFNHLHISIRVHSRICYVRFIRALTAHLIYELSRHFGINLKGIFQLRPFTRVVEWGRAYRRLVSYIRQNYEESFGKDVTGRWSRRTESFDFRWADGAKVSLC